MGLLSVSVKVGEAVQIGEVAIVKVDDRNGRSVKLKIATMDPSLRVTRIPTGIIPPAFLPTGLAPDKTSAALVA
ncbi:hypothetical protein SAMN05216456_1299 [Devosia crocina]|uniref:Uncharacterized protein n=1 Tax=Devosia crocina TaxID=429728 RepID=A0A1I7N9J0_9HYPH|nr:hypothetical protein [Devosia crocina]SFV31308.1 hypothetical protein SAMN05216456_1299 [Devosia crocina]